MVYTTRIQSLLPKGCQVHNRAEYEIVTLDDGNNTFSLYNKGNSTLLEYVEINSVYNMMMPFFAMTIDASHSTNTLLEQQVIKQNMLWCIQNEIFKLCVPR